MPPRVGARLSAWLFDVSATIGVESPSAQAPSVRNAAMMPVRTILLTKFADMIDLLGPPGESRAAITVGHADDIVLSQIRSRLHLDQLERQLAGILQTMFGADRDVDRFVLAHDHAVLAALHDRGAMDHDPVFGAVVVLLQAELAARLHGNALHLEAVAGIDRAVVAPRPVAGDVLVGLGAVALAQRLDQAGD